MHINCYYVVDNLHGKCYDILHRYSYDDLIVDAVYEGVTMLSIYDVDTDHGWNYASVSGVFNCELNTDIWVRAAGTGSINGSDQRSTFTVISLSSLNSTLDLYS